MSTEDRVSVGFKETKEVVDMVGGLVKAIDSSLEDGKINFMDVPNFFAVLPKIKPALDGVEQVPFEFKLASQQEAEDLKTYLQENFNLRDEEMEQFIEDCFSVVLDLWIILNRYISKPTEPVEPEKPVDAQDELQSEGEPKEVAPES